MLRAAFYKGTRPGIPGIYNRLVRWWTRSPYSHCELVFFDGRSASSSFMDGGVRFKKIDFNPDHWDFVDLPLYLEVPARDWFMQHMGQPYDILGNIHFILSPIGHDKRKWFCSEAMAAALGFEDPHRYDPGTLHSALRAFRQPPSGGFFTSTA
ncbi:MAG TPA: hypothetical protein VGU61_19960 [Noviherbaspirillum sp.]|jgi:hypothetical protein|uniref:hypothetical protein n=1 Tax=Noviherbaspirillum sp. TaxID=1926288 RepID=UPI002DDD4C2D|nr:hypothetical protein [Noviherbaspirillum sp.]HEV2612548.1 hypothetical protein [Noviherbaspirillum sp.]